MRDLTEPFVLVDLEDDILIHLDLEPVERIKGLPMKMRIEDLDLDDVMNIIVSPPPVKEMGKEPDIEIITRKPKQQKGKGKLLW